MPLSEAEITEKLKERFTEEYYRDFGSLISFQKEPGGEAYCPACDRPCNKHVGHKVCRETYRGGSPLVRQ